MQIPSRTRHLAAKGFSLIEMLIVVVVIGILAAIAVPNFIVARQQARASFFVATARSIGSSLEVFSHTHRGRYPRDGFLFNAPGNDSMVWNRDSGLIWLPQWKIDYEVHDNGNGANYVGLSYQGNKRFGESLFAVHTNIANSRNEYGRGETIPGTRELIFIFYEGVPSSQICPDATCN